MKFINNNNNILIGHFPGQTKNQFYNILQQALNIKFKIPENITIISPITPDQIPYSPLVTQLVNNNYKYINIVYDRYMRWEKSQKPFLIYDSLLQCPTEYALILDGNDVVIMDDLTDIIDRFNTYNKKVLFNPTFYMYPHIKVDDVPNREKLGKYCHLNAGCCFGKTIDLINFYKEVKKEVNKDHCPVDSEQYYVRKVFNKHQDEVFFDYKCKIFQCWHKAEISVFQDNLYVNNEIKVGVDNENNN